MKTIANMTAAEINEAAAIALNVTDEQYDAMTPAEQAWNGSLLRAYYTAKWIAENTLTPEDEAALDAEIAAENESEAEFWAEFSAELDRHFECDEEAE